MVLKTSKYEILALGVIFLAVAVRFLIGLQSPDSIAIGPGYVGSDMAVGGLMGMHVLDKGEFPFFFWGQSWFGGLEAFLHGVVFLIFGISVWAMRITTLFLFFLYCLTIFLIARELHNDRVGFFASLWCFAAPVTLTFFSLVPQTHYMETPVLGNITLWLAILLAKSRKPAFRRFLYFILGVMGGFGWWTSPLVAYYLLAIVFYILFKEKLRGVLLGFFLGLPGFMLGALPFFIYYFHESSSSLTGLGQGFELIRLGFGLKRFFLGVGPWILDVFLYKRFGSWAVGAISFYYIYVIFYYALFGESRNFLKLVTFRPNTDVRGILGLLFISIVMVYSLSEHATRFKPHYVIALVSIFPVACAYAASEVRKKWRFLTVSLYTLLIGVQSFFIWEWGVKDVPGYEKSAHEFLQLIDVLKKKGLTKVYGDYFLGSKVITLMSQEKIICADKMQERYHPYELMLDSVDSPAFIERKLGMMKPVFNQIAGSYVEELVSRFAVYHHFLEPGRQYLQIETSGIRGTSSHLPDQMMNVFDRNSQTSWQSKQNRSEGMWVQFDLGKDYSLGMVRLWNQGKDHMKYAMDVSVEVSLDGEKWQEVIPRSHGDFYYWTGPRIYYWEWGYRWEARFGPVEGRFIRIKQYEHSKNEWTIAEAYFYEDIGERTGGGHQGEREILDRIKALELDRVYADRWMSAKVRESSSGKIETIEPFTFAKSGYFGKFKSRIVKWREKTGFILENSDADRFEGMMKDEDIRLKREKYERWELFYFDSWGSRDEMLQDNDVWWWMGVGVVKVNRKSESKYLKEIGEREEKEGHLEEAASYYKGALEEYGNNQGARERLVGVLKKLERGPEAAEEEKILKNQRYPENRSFIEFEKGVEFLGYTILPGAVKAGGEVRVRYFWRLTCGPGAGVAVFVHLESAGRICYGDHVLLGSQTAVSPVLKDEVFVEEEILKVPPDAPAGEYQFGLGLYDVKTGKRYKIKKSSLPQNDRKVLVGTLMITPN